MTPCVSPSPCEQFLPLLTLYFKVFLEIFPNEPPSPHFEHLLLLPPPPTHPPPLLVPLKMLIVRHTLIVTPQLIFISKLDSKYGSKTEVKVTSTTFYEISNISHICSIFRKSVCVRVVHIFFDRASFVFPLFPRKRGQNSENL